MINRRLDKPRHRQERRMSLTTEPAGDARRWLALPVLLLGAFLPPLDFTVVNLALPVIRHSLGASASAVQFVISAYAAAYAVLLITGGRLGDLLGRKSTFMAGVAGFTLASVLCGSAWSPAALIAGRILQGLMATLMAPQVLASIRVLFPAQEQGRALALYGATFGLANTCGQILGGVLVSFHPFGFAWQAIFLINVPIGLAAFAGAWLFLRETRARNAPQLDIGGVVFLSLTLGLLIYPLVEGREAGWPVWMLAMLAASPLALIIFIRFETWTARHGGDPLVELGLFRNHGFVSGIVMAVAFYMQSSFFLTFAVYLQSGLHLNPLAAGIATLPYVGGAFLASLVSSFLMHHLGPRALTLGFVLQVVGFSIVICAIGGVFPAGFTTGLGLSGLGFGTIMPSVIKAVIGGIDQRHAGLAAGVVLSALQIGSALGVAIIGGIFYSALGQSETLNAYAHAMTHGLACNILLLALGGLLSLWLPGQKPIPTP
jgi:EmrB/QacA subfamily drug resistance transporter